MKMTKVASPFGGTDYRIGEYVAIREDQPSVDEWDHAARDVTWGLIPAAVYDYRGGDVGLPEAVREFGTLRSARRWVVESEAV